jgi:hypothetical protein
MQVPCHDSIQAFLAVCSALIILKTNEIQYWVHATHGY